MRPPDTEYLAAIVESSDDAIISKTLKGVITSWNAAAERLFGYTATEAVGQSIAILFPPERLAEEDMFLRQISRDEPIKHFETVRVRKDGERIDISVSLSPIRNVDGDIIGVSKIARDISARKQLEAARAELLGREQAARQQSEHANRIKDDFLATLSHELRTPANAVLGWACLVRDQLTDPDMLRRGIDAIIRNARIQADLIGDLLDVSRIITGSLRLNVEVIDPLSSLKAALDTIGPAAQAKELTLEIDAASHGALVWADPRRLQQIFWNLLINAVNYTQSGGRVTAGTTIHERTVEIHITDTGIGIAPDLLPHVFDRFRQGDQSHTREQRGLGLGLAIVRHLVELHGGTVHADSRGAGRGATFMVRFPIASLRELKVGVRADHPAAKTLVGLHLLVVEDQEDARTLVTLALQSAGADVFAAASADEALAAFERRPFDAIVSDVAMPGKDGLAFITEVREHQRDLRRRTPAIALTALISPEERAAALKAGFDRHIAKPLDPTTLPGVVVDVLSHRP